MSDKRDYYEVLGVDRDATERDIKKAYRKLAMEHHPDRNPGDTVAEEKFKEAAEAYAVLSEPEKRSAYDRFGHAGLGGAQAPDMGDIFSNFGDIFSDLFGFSGGGRTRNPNAPRRGADLQMRLNVPFEFAVHGGERVVSVPRAEDCKTCDGSGAKPGTSAKTCPQCNGAGRVAHTQGMFSVQTTCPRCHGEGRIIESPCADCNGAGQVQKTHDVTVKIPPGVDTGNRLRLRGEGEAGVRGGPTGDLYIHLAVEAPEVFERDGADLHLAYPLHYTQALLGAKLEVPTLTGNVRMEIEGGTQHGERRRLRGKGLPHVNRKGSNGDLYVHFQLEVPKKLTKRERELLEELATEVGVDAQEKHGFFDRIKELFDGPDADA